MHIDTVGFLRLHPCAMTKARLEQERIGLLILRGAENSGNVVLHHLKDSGGVQDHKVDVVRTSSSGITASIVMRGGISKGDRGNEPGLRNGNDTHIVVHGNVIIHVIITVHHHAGDTSLDKPVGGWGHEKNTALVRHFGVVQRNGGSVNSRDSTSTSRQIGGSLIGSSRPVSVSCKPIIRIQQGSLLLARPNRFIWAAAYFYAD